MSYAPRYAPFLILDRLPSFNFNHCPKQVHHPRSLRSQYPSHYKSLARLQKLGVKVVTDVDKASFIKIAEPLQDKLAKGLGPHAEKILQVCRSIE
jgi:hypothetical protein